jgi:hypothetical protein
MGHLPSPLPDRDVVSKESGPFIEPSVSNRFYMSESHVLCH